MKIVSIDSNQSVEIITYQDQYYTSFSMNVSVDIKHGKFTGENIDLQFLNLQTFVQTLEMFITDKTVIPKLEGIYDSFIEFVQIPNGNILLNFTIGDAYCGYSNTVDYSLSGSFEFSPNTLNQILDDCKGFLDEV